MSAERFRYKAFISYSHRDTKSAAWLHRALESYAIPKRLIGRETTTGTIGKRVGAIFRDRDELPVAADLTGQINDALSATQFLIVLCSTTSAKSKWVNQEIINFKRLKGASSIIAVIVDGEPYATNMPGREGEECFPPALRFHVNADGTLTDQPAEPIAADLRPDKDPKRLVRMKVLAGLLGVGLDELIRRDNQRRQQWMAAITLGSLILVGVMGALTFNAIEARNEAEIKRTQAEGLVEYMLSDLGERLQTVGRLDVLDSLSSKTLEYYERLKPNELDNDALGRRARALILLGKIQDQKGDRTSARTAFVRARETTSERLKRDPDNPQFIYDYAQSVYWIGSLDWQAGQITQAEPELQEYANIAGNLLKLNPDNPTWQAERSYAETNLGVLLLQEGRFTDAREHLAEAKRIKATLLKNEPSSSNRQLDFGQSLAWIADNSRALGEIKSAIQNRKEEILIYDALRTADHRNVLYTQRLVTALRSLSPSYLDLGEAEESARYSKLAIELSEELRKVEPGNTSWEERRGRSYIEMSEALFYLGKFDDSAAALTIGQEVARDLVNKNIENWRWQTYLVAGSIILVGLHALQNGTVEKTLPKFQAVKETLAQLAEKHPKESEIVRIFAKLLIVEGDLNAAIEQQPRAKVSWQTALDKIRRLNTWQIQDKALEATLLRRLERNLESQELNREIMLTDYRHPAFGPSAKCCLAPRSLVKN